MFEHLSSLIGTVLMHEGTESLNLESIGPRGFCISWKGAEARDPGAQ